MVEESGRLSRGGGEIVDPVHIRCHPVFVPPRHEIMYHDIDRDSATFRQGKSIGCEPIDRCRRLARVNLREVGLRLCC